MREFTTMEKLSLEISAGYGVVVKYNDHVLVTDINFKGEFRAEIYEFIETPEETGLGDCECRLNLYSKSENTFADGGHALKWCFEQLK